jgi:hypothetical protein
MSSVHGCTFQECLKRYCEVWRILDSRLPVEGYLRLWCRFFDSYLYNDPKTEEEKKKEHSGAMTDLQLAILLHFASIHGTCMRIDDI